MPREGLIGLLVAAHSGRESFSAECQPCLEQIRVRFASLDADYAEREAVEVVRDSVGVLQSMKLSHERSDPQRVIFKGGLLAAAGSLACFNHRSRCKKLLPLIEQGAGKTEVLAVVRKVLSRTQPANWFTSSFDRRPANARPVQHGFLAKQHLQRVEGCRLATKCAVRAANSKTAIPRKRLAILPARAYGALLGRNAARSFGAVFRAHALARAPFMRCHLFIERWGLPLFRVRTFWVDY